MNDRELLEYIATQVGTLTSQVDTLTKDMSEAKSRLISVENIVTRIEHDHGQKLQALFDGLHLGLFTITTSYAYCTLLHLLLSLEDGFNSFEYSTSRVKLLRLLLRRPS